MTLRDKKLITLKEIEGVVGTHDAFVKKEMDRRKEAFLYIHDVAQLAQYIGGKVVPLGLGEDWAIKKEIFPGVEIFFLYYHEDEEFSSKISVLYSGERVRKIRGEDLAAITIACVNHMLRQIREVNPERKLPEICYKV